MKRTSVLLLGFVIAIISGLATNQVFAETGTSTSDNAVIIVITAGVLGSVTAPVILWATKENTPDSTGKLPNDPFNRRQYILALLIGIPSVTGLLITEVSGLNATINGLQGVVILFLMAFVQALGVDIGKSRIGSAITNK